MASFPSDFIQNALNFQFFQNLERTSPSPTELLNDAYSLTFVRERFTRESTSFDSMSVPECRTLNGTSLLHAHGLERHGLQIHLSSVH